MTRLTMMAIVGLAALRAVASAAAELPPDVLVQSGRVTITRAEFDAELANVPPGMRQEFAANSERLSKVMNALLETKSLAAEARANGLDKDPEVQARVAAQVDRVLAQARGEQIEREAAAAFDRRRDDFLGRARELYLLEKAKYTLPERIRAAHILIRYDRRGKDEALRLAQEVRARALADGADFAALAREYSEDATVKTNNGSLGWFAQNQMDKDFWAGASALQKPGAISEPVLSSYGYHIIRLEERRPPELQAYETVKDRVMAEVKRDYVKMEKTKVLDSIFKDPALRVNQPALDALVTTIDADAFRNAAGMAAPKK
jgi:peptidyl-prolyl cis-trans isomerase C